MGWRWVGPLVAVVMALTMAGVLWGWRSGHRRLIGPEQPIPFSHRVHAGDKRIGCLLCHDQAARGAVAGMPSVETCMLCHSRIIVTHPAVRRVRDHYFDRRPVAWVQLFDVPDHVHFDHSVHLHRSVDCGRCHGAVAAMDRLPARELTMGFCISCHREYEATHDCFICHR